MSDKVELKIVDKDKIYGWKNTHDKIIKHIQEYPNTTIAAAVTRISNIFDEHKFVYGTFSGGKDSGVTSILLALVWQLRKNVKNGVLSLEQYNKIVKGKSTMNDIVQNIKPVLMTMDPELAYSMTGHAYERMFKQYCGQWNVGDFSWVSDNNEENPGNYSKEDIMKMSTEEIQELVTGYGKESLMDGFWMAFPIAWENMVSQGEARYWSFDDRVPAEQWGRDLPVGNYVWNQENFYDFPLRYGFPPVDDSNVTIGSTDQDLRTKFSKYLKNAVHVRELNNADVLADEILSLQEVNYA